MIDSEHQWPGYHRDLSANLNSVVRVQSVQMMRFSPLHINVAHLFSSKECVILKHNLVRVPDDHPQLPGARLPGTDVNLSISTEALT